MPVTLHEGDSLYNGIQQKAARRVRNGLPSNNLTFSALQGNNEDLFPRILELYVAAGSVIADITYGKGVFWKRVAPDRYDVRATDMATGTDSRMLPYLDATIDCVIFDPPYMHSPGGSAHVGHQNFEQYYHNNEITHETKKYHEAVLDCYFSTAVEVMRVLRPGGIFIVKCEDEVCANQQRLSLLSGQKVNNSNWLLSSAPLNRSGVAKIADWIGIFSNTVTERTCSNV